jgi:alkylation response protein AidB-like acyl-CoA dehydrogenase
MGKEQISVAKSLSEYVSSYINEYPTGRLLRDAKLYEIGAGTSEIRRILIGRELVRSSTAAA